MKDAELVRKALAGKADAYGELVERWAAPVVGLCHGYTGRAELADEVAVEVLLRGFEELPTLADPSRFGPWLANLAARVARGWRTARPQGNWPANSPTPSRPANADLIADVEALPEESRIALMLYYYQAMNYRELADLIEESVGEVHARLTKARMVLSERLHPHQEIA